MFVLFLDAYHVGTGGSARVRTALPAFFRRGVESLNVTVAASVLLFAAGRAGGA